jgi:Zn finger protein HypA/HybF involved in hydrogenase expression
MTEQNNDNNEQQDVGLYEKLANRTAELLEEGKKTLDEALKKAKDELSKAGDFSSEQMDKMASYVRRDLAENAEKASEAVKKTVDPHRVAAGVQSVFSRILTSTADALGDLAQKTEKNLAFKTGEVTSPGTLTCKDCGAEMHMKSTVRIPPCPKCHKTLFRKSY